MNSFIKFIRFILKAFFVFIGIAALLYPGWLFKAIGVVILFWVLCWGDWGTNEKNKQPNISYYWDLESEILHACWDDYKNTFDSKIWFDRRDEIIHTAPENVLSDIDYSIKCYGRNQVYYINAILSGYSSNPSGTIQRLKSIETTIVRNLDMEERRPANSLLSNLL